MKKIITLFCFLFVLLSISSEISYSNLKDKYCLEYTEIIKIEYIFIDGIWWKIIYYTDGNIEIQMSQTSGD